MEKGEGVKGREGSFAVDGEALGYSVGGCGEECALNRDGDDAIGHFGHVAGSKGGDMLG